MSAERPRGGEHGGGAAPDGVLSGCVAGYRFMVTSLRAPAGGRSAIRRHVDNRLRLSDLHVVACVIDGTGVPVTGERRAKRPHTSPARAKTIQGTPEFTA